MDERDQMPDPTSPLADDDEAVRRLLEAAGPRPQVPEEDLAAIAATARWAWEAEVRRRAKRRRRPARLVAAWAAVAAMLALSLGLGWWLASRQETAPAMVAQVEALTGPVHLALEGRPARALAAGESIPGGAVLRTSGGGEGPESRASLRLAGGATLRVDAGTRLRFAAAGVLELQAGAVYADTGSGGGAGALAVRTALGTARDVGTQFAVRLEPAAPPAMRVRVRDGAVVVERRGRSYRTATGQELVLREDGSVARHEIPAYGPGWEWVMAAGAGFEIEGRTLQELLDWVARETGWKVRFADSDLAAAAQRIVLHGDPGRPLRPDEAPFLVLPGAGLEGELHEGVLTVRRAGS
jgi:hypothetical protein